MIKNKAIHAMIIGTCIFANTIAGVYADTTDVELKAPDQVMQVTVQDELTKKQSEIDQYVFEKHAKDFADKGITVTNTGVIGDVVEVGITPYNEENAKYIYDIFGKEDVKVVEGIQAVTFGADGAAQDVTIQIESAPIEAQTIAAPAEKEASPIAAFFSSIWEWIKNIY
ncbi:MAG TPA: hypothetical protein VEG39_12800 [Clostridia bacterium]|nr:hypothetical protein [Clostridia bacterium]